jgi:uncharacterized phage protein (TIGR02216 family)
MTRFAEAARRLSGLATVMLGWRPDEFWRATPEELAAIFEALRGDAPERVPLAELMKRFPDAENNRN